MPPTNHAYWKLAEIADKVKLLRENDRLRERNRYLEAENARLRKEQNKDIRTAREKPFGNDTPSSKVTFKPDAKGEASARQGGGARGHAGHGRKAADESDADETVRVPRPAKCDVCGGDLVDFKTEERTVRVAVAPHYRTVRYVIATGWCPDCRRQVSEKVTGVLPHFAASNALLAQNVLDRYVYGMTVGTQSARTGLGKGTLFNEYEALARLLRPCMHRLLALYRLSYAKGADETTWRCNGRNGYVYAFFADGIALFRFRGTRKSYVAAEVFGRGDCFGVLVRDRYPGYDNTFRGRQQYCYEHLKRDCLGLLEREPENAEYKAFVPKFVGLLREAMSLRRRAKTDAEYYSEAGRIKSEMLGMINAEARDADLQKYQDVFRRHPDRVFQWVCDRNIPAENNMSERGVRRTVIARKTCGGSQSDKALMTREVLQSVIESLRLRHPDPVGKLAEALDAYAANPKTRIEDLLFPLP